MAGRLPATTANTGVPKALSYEWLGGKALMKLAFSSHKILLLVGSMWVNFYHFGIQELEIQRATSIVMEVFKNFTGLSNLMGPGLLGIMSVKDFVTSWIFQSPNPNGRLYTATPVDPVFILLPIFEEARMKKGNDPGKFRQLDEIIYIHGYPGYQSLSSIAEKSMQVVCDLKEVGSTKFFRLNDLKVLKWLCYKVHQLKKTLPTLDNNYAAQDEKDSLSDAVSIVGEYLKDEPWIKLTRPAKAGDTDPLPPSTGSDPASFNPVQDNNGIDKKVGRNTRQVKKARVEKDSQNIKDMFSRATRRRG
ncbi:Ribonuclease H2 subunit B [Sesamum angolense]|uniref:Ribonuclease H2 subunit B n=1 Tax=Sesamum angolense TaxID=2727404 RepID=A0AAE2BW19_9LAMI|nr:Ribonuclease H2 subunit B [Sesamum angolense]